MIKVSNVWTAVLLTGILVCAALFLCQAAQAQPMSNAQFADIIANVLGLEMPAGADELSDAELFEVQANALAERGITLFVDANPDELVTRSDLANVLYDALKGPNTATVEEKINYLVGLGYMSVGAAQVPDEEISSNEIIEALNIPELTRAIAQAYSRPPRGVIRAGIAPAPAFPESESFASPIW